MLLGSAASVAEVTHVSRHGFWLLLGNEELHIPFAEFPWFRTSTIEQITTVEWPSAHHLYWPMLDVDGAVASIRQPADSPLMSRVTFADERSRDERVRRPVRRTISKRLYRHISQSVCPWNAKFSQALAEDSPFRAREFVAGKDAVTLATDILALDQEQSSAAFRKSPMKRAKLVGLKRNAVVVLTNVGTTEL